MSDECVSMYDIERSIKKHIFIYYITKKRFFIPIISGRMQIWLTSIFNDKILWKKSFDDFFLFFSKEEFIFKFCITFFPTIEHTASIIIALPPVPLYFLTFRLSLYFPQSCHSDMK